MTKNHNQNIDNEVKFLIEHYTGCEYKTLWNYSLYIKKLLVSNGDNCLKNVNSGCLIGKDFWEINKDITGKKVEEMTFLSEKFIKRKQLIYSKYYDEKNSNSQFCKTIDLYFQTLFMDEVLWGLEFMQEKHYILNKEQKEIFDYLSNLAKIYIKLTDTVMKRENNIKVKVLEK